MRIVAGEKRGQRLAAPRGSATRPTSDRVREALFAMLADVTGDRVLDLFAGSGALGLEALSRGAAHADFCDTSAAAVAACRANIERLGYAERSTVRRVDARRRLASDAAAGRTYDLMLIDPPYRMMDAMQQALSLHIAQIVAPGGRVAIESAADAEPVLDGMVAERSRVHGGTRITLLRHG